MRQLEMLLSDISEEERADAMAFYRDYFEDAGIGNEERVLEELGSPENVAEIIKRDLGMLTIAGVNNEKKEKSTTAGAGYGTYDEANHTYTYRSTQSQQARNEGYTMYHDSVNPSHNEKHSNTILILAIIIAVLTSPLWLGIVTGLLGTVFGISVTLIACTFAMFAVGIAFVGVGISMIMGISGAAGVAFIGAGLLVLAIAILMLNACVWVFGRFFPWAVKGLIGLCKKLFGKNKEAQAI